ncbi:hypothetical protein FOZ63_011413, partial [Perkinsus olseni]
GGIASRSAAQSRRRRVSSSSTLQAGSPRVSTSQLLGLKDPSPRSTTPSTTASLHNYQAAPSPSYKRYTPRHGSPWLQSGSGQDAPQRWPTQNPSRVQEPRCPSSLPTVPGGASAVEDYAARVEEASSVATEGAIVEQQAMVHDKANRMQNAITCYVQASNRLAEA